MGRPTTKRRLRDINPDDFGRTIAEHVKTHVAILLDPADEDAELVRVVERRVAQIATEATLVARYARDGVGNNAISDLLAMRVWLYSCAGLPTPSQSRIEKLLNRYPDNDDIRIVLLAAHARVRLDSNEAVPVRELACLASVDPDHVRLLARQGQMALISGGVVAPRIAKRWLAERGMTS